MELEEEVEFEFKKLKVGDVELDDELEFLEVNFGEVIINVVCLIVEGDSSLTG